jgi:hypothetical protein
MKAGKPNDRSSLATKNAYYKLLHATHGIITISARESDIFELPRDSSDGPSHK